MASQYYRVLYFILTMAPTAEQRRDAVQYGPHCAFRNAAYHVADSALEECTAVAGEVPDEYAAVYPRAVTIADWYNGKLSTVPMAAETGMEGDDDDGGEEGTGEGAEATGDRPPQAGDPFAKATAPAKVGRSRAQAAAWKPQG